jgi:hypothetical protein
MDSHKMSKVLYQRFLHGSILITSKHIKTKMLFTGSFTKHITLYNSIYSCFLLKYLSATRIVGYKIMLYQLHKTIL